MIRNAARVKSPHEGLITALAIGGFFIILGSVFAFTPGIVQDSNAFVSDLTTVSFPFGSPGSTVSLLGPANPADHQDFYTAVMNFLIGVGVLQIVILALRLAVQSRIRRIAESVGDLIFLAGCRSCGKHFPISRNTQRLVPILVSLNHAHWSIVDWAVLRVYGRQVSTARIREVKIFGFFS